MKTLNNYDVMPVSHPGERHVPCVCLLDTSISMDGAPIRELNQGMIEMGNALLHDELARGRAELCIFTFDKDVKRIVDWTSAESYSAPSVTAKGCTSMNQAINEGLNAIAERTEFYRDAGVQYYKPWLFLLTDGCPTDPELTDSTRARLRGEIEAGLNFYPMAIGENADQEFLRAYYPENWKNKWVLHADEKHFKEAFVWISQSIGKVVKAKPGQRVGMEILPQGITVSYH